MLGESDYDKHPREWHKERLDIQMTHTKDTDRKSLHVSELSDEDLHAIAKAEAPPEFNYLNDLLEDTTMSDVDQAITVVESWLPYQEACSPRIQAIKTILQAAKECEGYKKGFIALTIKNSDRARECVKLRAELKQSEELFLAQSKDYDVLHAENKRLKQNAFDCLKVDNEMCLENEKLRAENKELKENLSMAI